MPGRIHLRRHKMFYFTALIVLCLLLFAIPAVREFLIIDYKTGEILFCSKVKPGDNFSITYIHSVNKSPVEDQFYINNSYTILIQKSIFKSFGAGVPSNPDEGGKFVFYNDRIEVVDISRKIEKMILFVGVIADHHFLMNGKDIKLNELSSPQRSVQFLVKKITVYQYLKYIISQKAPVKSQYAGAELRQR